MRRECRVTNLPVFVGSSLVWRLPDSRNSVNYDLVYEQNLSEYIGPISKGLDLGPDQEKMLDPDPD